MNVNYPDMFRDAEEELGKYFDCPANSKSHLMIVVFPWVQQRLRDQLIQKIKELTSFEMDQSWDWVDRNVWLMSSNIVNRLFKKKS